LFMSYFIRSAFLMAFAHLALELGMNFLPVIYPVLINTWRLSYTQVGLVAMVASTGASLTQPLFGYLSDRWGAQKLAVASIAWMGAMMGLVGFAPSYLSLLVLIALGALGSAAFHPAATTLALTGGGKSRGAAASIFAVGGNLGTAFSPLWMTASFGWLGLTSTALIIPTTLLVSLALYWQLNRAGNASSSRAGQPRPALSAGRGSLFGLALLISAVMCRSWVDVSLITYLPQWLQSQGQSLAESARMLSLFLISTGLGSLTGGSLSDRAGHWQVLALSLGLLSPALWFFLVVSGPLQVGLVGFLIGLSFPVSVVMAQETWPRGVGLASALVMGLGWAPGGLGASVTGLIADRFSLATGLQWLIVPSLLGIVCVLALALWQRFQKVAAEAPGL
jgi:FSR family fosmidomycin resistance protein-like MFS transporter